MYISVSPPINLPSTYCNMCGTTLQLQSQLLPPAPLLFVISRFIAPMFPKYAAPNDVSGSTFDEAFGDGGVSAMLAKTRTPDVGHMIGRAGRFGIDDTSYGTIFIHEPRQTLCKSWCASHRRWSLGCLMHGYMTSCCRKL